MSVSVKRGIDWTFSGNLGPKATKLLPLLYLVLSKYTPKTAVQSDPTLHFFVFCLYLLIYFTLKCNFYGKHKRMNAIVISIICLLRYHVFMLFFCY
jgi:hypothetical protein